MAMTMTGAVTLPADKALVWEKLNDPALLQACIPGCQSLERMSGTRFLATARIKIGPVSTTFKGHVSLSNIDPPDGYRITGEGEGGLAGFASGMADVTLAEAAGGGTTLSYDVRAQIGGRIAQLGGRWVGGVAKRTADAFFARFAAALRDEQPVA